MLSIQSVNKLDLQEPIFIPYDIKVSNSTKDKSRFLSFNDTRSVPFINAVNNYVLTIERFQIQTPKNLPVFIPVIETNQADINRTIYEIILEQVGTGFTNIQISWQPQDLTATPPAGPVGNVQNNIGNYYKCFNYQHFLNIINGSVYTLCKINTAPPLADEDIPFFTLDESTLNIEFNYSIKFTGFPPVYRLFFNEALYNLFGTLPALKTLTPSTILNKYQLSPQFPAISTGNYPGTVIPIYKTTSENTPLAQWNPIESITFTSNLPLVSTATANAGQFNSTDFGDSSVGNNIANIISSFAVPFGPNNTYRAYINYTPTGQYRFFDLIGTSPLTTININVYYSDWFGNFYPLYLDPGCNANISLLFVRKDYNGLSTNTMLAY
jgi:hypothetical protein